MFGAKSVTGLDWTVESGLPNLATYYNRLFCIHNTKLVYSTAV